MNKYIGKRFLQLIPVLLGITFLSFAMMRAAGSDAIIELYGDKGAVAQEIIDGVDFVVNPRFEGKPTRKASSIIAFGEGGEVKIIRE